MKKIYVIFATGTSKTLCFYPLETLPEDERSLIQSHVDTYEKKLSTSIDLEFLSNHLHVSNFFDLFYDGICFPFRGNGAMFVSLVLTEDVDLTALFIRESLLSHIDDDSIIEMLLEKNIIKWVLL